MSGQKALILITALSFTLAACGKPGHYVRGLGTGGQSPGTSSHEPGGGTNAPGVPAPASGEPVTADPPPITLGDYPWILISHVSQSADGKTATVRGLALDVDDPPGIPVKSGYVKIHGSVAGEKVPIKIIDAMKGDISFQVPSHTLDSGNVDIILTGPGYKEVPFPVCN